VENDKITINKIEYNIIKRFYRTRGSANQILTDDKNKLKRIEDRVSFYLANNKNNKFWIKEVNFNPEDYIGNTGNEIEVRKEFQRGEQINNLFIEKKQDNISSVKYLDYEKNVLVQEYCDKYVRYGTILLTEKQKERIIDLIRLWLSEITIENYDLSKNNTLIKVLNDSISIKMVDLADSKAPRYLIKNIKNETRAIYR